MSCAFFGEALCQYSGQGIPYMSPILNALIYSVIQKKNFAGGCWLVKQISVIDSHAVTFLPMRQKFTKYLNFKGMPLINQKRRVFFLSWQRLKLNLLMTPFIFCPHLLSEFFLCFLKPLFAC